jgi:arsenate reductase-like glutaredoxin family protein
VTKGKNIVHFDMADDKPSDSELAAVLLGPSGNLRSPTIRRGKTLLVGFNEEMFREQLR